MKNRVNVIINGKRDINKVADNLKNIINSDDCTIIYTFVSEKEIKNVLSNITNKTESEISDMMTYSKFNEYKKSEFCNDFSKKFIIFKMPNLLFKKIPNAFNAALKFVDETEIARFVHFFCDDVKEINFEKYDPSLYEWYMTKFDCPFISDPKTNTGNFAFKKLAPRFVLVSQKLKHPISFYQFEGKEHFIIDRSLLKENFDEHLNRMYMTEYIIRLNKKGIIKHMTFYPDPFLETLFTRDCSMEYTLLTDDVKKQFESDDKYISDTLKVSIIPESSVDPIIEEHGRVIDTFDDNVK